jgi:protein phosphatase 1 regulatory subunit 36
MSLFTEACKEHVRKLHNNMVGTIKKDEATGNEKKHKNTFVLATALT